MNAHHVVRLVVVSGCLLWLPATGSAQSQTGNIAGEMLVRYFENESDRRNICPTDSLAALQREAATAAVRPESEWIAAVESG